MLRIFPLAPGRQSIDGNHHQLDRQQDGDEQKNPNYQFQCLFNSNSYGGGSPENATVSFLAWETILIFVFVYSKLGVFYTFDLLVAVPKLVRLFFRKCSVL